ncbi:MAG: 50S ribosomal protein L19e [Candidatus Micrarchaeota archaeon]|nr:50S ribosomal protein L19e [Candidatus Micrarchaeota archaeon]
MGQHTIRRLAASVMGVGENRIWFDPANLGRIREALTRDDVRNLVKEGLIRAEPARGVSRFRARERQAGKRVGRRRGHGSRKGTSAARSPPKGVWMAKVRLQRKILRNLTANAEIKPEAVRSVYGMIKGNAFRGKGALAVYLKENDLLTPAGAKSAADTSAKKVAAKVKKPSAGKAVGAPTAGKPPVAKK